MPTGERPTNMKTAEDDPTLNRVWLRTQMDRALAFEILSKSIRSDYSEMELETLTDRIGVSPGMCLRIIKKLQRLHT